VVEQWRRECFDSFWRRPGLYARGHYERFPDVPMVFMSSWYDPYALTATENFAALSKRKRGPVRLVMGPWTHGQRSVRHAGAVDFGPAATLDGNVAPDYVTLRRDFFDRHLRGLDVHDWLAAPVTLFVMGGGEGTRTAEGRMLHGGAWMRAEEWPPRRARPTSWYLRAGGSLGAEPPPDRAELSWRFALRDPVPTLGGATASGAPLMEAGASDQRETEAVYGARHPGRPVGEREDVQVFESAPLGHDDVGVGPVVARLWVSTSARDAAFTVKLIDV